MEPTVELCNWCLFTISHLVPHLVRPPWYLGRAGILLGSSLHPPMPTALSCSTVSWLGLDFALFCLVPCIIVFLLLFFSCVLLSQTLLSRNTWWFLVNMMQIFQITQVHCLASVVVSGDHVFGLLRYYHVPEYFHFRSISMQLAEKMC